MSWPKFLLGNVVGALCWAPTLVLTGYLAASLPWVKHASIAVASVAVIATVVVTLLRLRTARAEGPETGGR
jgi:membrane protein DedA with SNARE-associated domain